MSGLTEEGDTERVFLILMCALSSYNAIWVKFPLRQSIVVSLTSTASLETAGWEAEGNGACLRVRWTLEIGTSDYSGMPPV